MVETMKNNLVKVAQQAKLAVPLPIKMQHPYQYSKWDSIHEPYNIVENVLGDNQTVYKGLTPEFDFNLSDHQEHYISEVLIWPGDCGPNEVELYVGNQNGWQLVKGYTCARVGVSRLVVPYQFVSKYLRVKCMNNVRGGNIVSVRHIVVKGLPY